MRLWPTDCGRRRLPPRLLGGANKLGNVKNPLAFTLELSPVRPDLRGSRNTVVALVTQGAAGDALAIRAAPSASDQATASAAADSFKLTLTGVATIAITVTARDDRGGTASATFAVTVVAAPTQPESETPAPAEQQDVVTRYDTDGDGKISSAE